MSEVRIGFARESARSILQRMGVQQPPVDVHDVATREGLTIRILTTWPTTVSGLLLRNQRLVGLNGNHSRRRQRFSLAHELGHWFMHREWLFNQDDITIDNPPESDATENRSEENEADEFAGELLAPRAFIKAAMKKTKSPNALAEIFDISSEAMWVRLLRHSLL